tara:strand:+ start:98 stop:895 length:798 start_codon:yes stop_codon:yes gene_type:complete
MIEFNIVFKKYNKFINLIKFIMVQLPKLKVKVYFYHLFIFAVVVLLCFYLMYKDMKRIEKNVLNLYNKVNLFETQLLQISTPMPSPILNKSSNTQSNDNENKNEELNNIISEIDDIDTNIINNEDALDKLEDNKSLVDNVNIDTINHVATDGNLDTLDKLEDNNDIVTKEDKDSDSDSDSDSDKSLTIEDDGSIDKEVEVLNDEVDDLLDDLEEPPKLDLSSLTKEELLDKKNDELRNYLKSLDLSTNGNKNQLVENILENRKDK